MKKPYEKPILAVEYYQLTQAIASCATKIGLYDSNCVLKDPDSTSQMKEFAAIGWFNAGYCMESASGMDGFDSICYHTNLNTAFSS